MRELIDCVTQYAICVIPLCQTRFSRKSPSPENDNFVAVIFKHNFVVLTHQPLRPHQLPTATYNVGVGSGQQTSRTAATIGSMCVRVQHDGSPCVTTLQPSIRNARLADGGKCVPVKMSFGILAAADHYDVYPLMEKCIQHITKNISVNNAFHVLDLGQAF